jgi:hypothetical protein
MMKKIFVSGIYRSGTTFIQQLLNRSSRSTVLYQPYFPIFREFEREIKRNLFPRTVSKYPMGSLAFPDLAEIKNIKLDSNSISNIVTDYIDNLATYSSHKESVEKEFLRYTAIHLRPGYLYDIIDQLFRNITNYFGEHSQVGFKELFVVHFANIMLDYDPDLAIILTVRDPREIYFSRINKEYHQERHPVIMFSEIWNNYAKLSRTLSANHKQIKVVTLEDIRSGHFNRILSELTFDKNSIRDWTNSYSCDGTKNYGERWRDSMKLEYVRVIEHICGKEMQQLNYRLDFDYDPGYNFIEDFSDVKKYTMINRYSSLDQYQTG